MNTQEIFNLAVSTVYNQGEPSIYTSPVGDIYCRYRGQDNLKCAVGAIIKDEFYHSKLEGQLPTDTDVVEALEKSIGKKIDRQLEYLLDVLQSTHDEPISTATYNGLEHNWNRDIFLKAANKVAEEFDLSPWIPEE